MKAVKITEGIWWAGAQNPQLRIFDVVMTTEWGTSYNSYLVKGTEKTALIDSVRDGFLEGQLEELKEICDPSKIDYIVCNHTEPDHSGSLKAMMDVAPNAVIVCSRPAKTLIKEITNRDFECMVVGDGDSIDLGGKTLKFISAPFLHWPDTIFTYAEEDKVLFTCDMFGFHFAAEEVFDDLTKLSAEMVESQKYYFDVIMSPFKPYVRQAIEKIRPLDIAIIAPSHGPVLRGDPQGAVERYEEWAQPAVNEPKKIFIGYVSCYGYTTKLAEQVEAGAKSVGNFDVELVDVGCCGAAEASVKIMAADAFALGSPTLNRDVLPPIWEVMTGLCAYIVKDKRAGVFGCYGWSGEACKYMEQRLTNLGVKVLGEARAKMDPNEDELKIAYVLGESLAKSLDGQ